MSVDLEEIQQQPQSEAFSNINKNLDKSRMNVSVILFSEDNRELNNAPIVVVNSFF